MFALLRFKYLYYYPKKNLSWVYNFHFCMYNKVHFNIRYRFCTFIPPCGFPRWYLVLFPKRDSSSSTMPDSFFILVFLWKCSLNNSRTKEPQLTAVEPYAMPLKKRQLVQEAFDEEHAVWNGQCRALKERVHPHGLLMVPVLLAA